MKQEEAAGRQAGLPHLLHSHFCPCKPACGKERQQGHRLGSFPLERNLLAAGERKPRAGLGGCSLVLQRELKGLLSPPLANTPFPALSSLSPSAEEQQSLLLSLQRGWCPQCRWQWCHQGEVMPAQNCVSLTCAHGNSDAAEGKASDLKQNGFHLSSPHSKALILAATLPPSQNFFLASFQVRSKRRRGSPAAGLHSKRVCSHQSTGGNQSW